MSRPYMCDQCEGTQTEPMSFALQQITDDLDDDGNPETVELHLCSAQCLSNYAMGLTLDFETDEETT
jgi:hypothetical protein